MSTSWVIAALVAAGACLPAPCATVVIGKDGGPVIAAGSAQIYLSFAAVIEHTNNLLYVDAEKTPSWVRVVSPGVGVELPFSHSLLRLGYNLSLTNYGQEGGRWNSAHTALFDLDLAFGSGMTVVLHDDFHLGIVDNRIGVPGGELPFQGQRYQTNAAEISVGHERAGRHEMGFRFRSLQTTYLEPIVAPYFDDDAWSLAAIGSWHVREQAWLVWEAQGGRDQLDRPESSVAEADQRTEREAGLLVGAGWELARNTVFQFLLGPKRLIYDAEVPSTFRGLVGRMVVANTSPVGLRWSVDLGRDAFASVFGINNYFVSQLLLVQAEMPRGAAVRFGGSTAYYRNDYPTDVDQRRDRIWGVETWMGIRQGVWVEWRTFVRYDLRSSTFPGVDYSTFRFGAGLVIGR